MNFEEWWEKDSGWYDGEPLLSEGHLAKAAWNAATEAAKPRWIPVSERLPSLVNWYPCLNVDSTNWSREFFSVTDNCFKSDSGITITHWLELPELPE